MSENAVEENKAPVERHKMYITVYDDGTADLYTHLINIDRPCMELLEGVWTLLKHVYPDPCLTDATDSTRTSEAQESKTK